MINTEAASRHASRVLLHGHGECSSESCPWRVNQASSAPCSNPSEVFSRSLMTLPLDDALISSAAAFVPRLTSASKSAEETQSRTPARRRRARSLIAGGGRERQNTDKKRAQVNIPLAKLFRSAVVTLRSEGAPDPSEQHFSPLRYPGHA